MTSQAQNQAERLVVLDALRGFALLGILFANIHSISGWWPVGAEARALMAPGYADAYEQFLTLFVDGKFYTLFSLMFGIGFALQLASIERAGAGVPVYVRRLFILFLFGAVHMTLIWFGDILLPYAVLGFLLLAVRKATDSLILVLAAISFVLPLAGESLKWILGGGADFGLFRAGFAQFSAHSPSEAFGFIGFATITSWSDQIQAQLGAAMVRIGYLLDSWRMFKLAGVMLVGVWIGRRLVNGALLEDTRFLKRAAIIGLVVGLPGAIAYSQLSSPMPGSAGSAFSMLQTAAYMLGVFPLGFAYAALFVLAWKKWPDVLDVFAAPGRMALTNYISQSVIMITIFYGVGFGYMGTVGPPTIFAIVAAIFIFQIIASKLWLSVFRFGPLEWVWRCATYAKLMPIRRSPTVGPAVS